MSYNKKITLRKNKTSQLVRLYIMEQDRVHQKKTPPQCPIKKLIKHKEDKKVTQSRMISVTT